MSSLKTEIIARISVITAAFSMVSYIVMQKNAAAQDRLDVSIPMIFALYGAVMMINILYCLKRHRVLDMK